MIQLPIDQFIPEILSNFTKRSHLILTASPGAGKTTRLPPALISLTDKKVLVLEPRRIAAVAATQRIAQEQNWKLGQEIGYQVRFDSKSNDKTRLIFLTEALLTQKMIQDPELNDVGIVVLDEFHERSVNTDLALGLLKELQELSRPDLKIVLMSATLEVDSLQKYLPDAHTVHVPGKIFPLEISYSKESQGLQTNFQWAEKVADSIRKNFSLSFIKDMIVFLPGAGEIEKVASLLETWATQNSYLICKLHGSLDLSDQTQVLEPQKQRKIVLATNIAESSITIDGVNAVIDTGLSKQMSLHGKTGFPQLLTRRISKSSATQRAGRAARQEQGYCYRLWSKNDELSMLEHEQAEIFRKDLSETLLSLSLMGVRDFKSFSWFEKPKDAAIEKSTSLLKALQLLDNDHNPTPLGKKAAGWPLPLRMAILMEKAIALNKAPLGAALAALLSEKDIVRNDSTPDSGSDCDISYRLEAFQQFLKTGQIHNLNRSACYQAKKSMEQLLNKSRISGKASDYKLDVEQVPSLILSAFSDRLAFRRRANAPQGIMSSGRGVILDQKSLVKKAPFFIALNLVEGLSAADTKVSLACGISQELIEKEIIPYSEIVTEVNFDEKLEKVVKRSYRAFTGIPLEEAKTLAVSQEEVLSHLPQVAVARWDFIKEKNEQLNNWLQRFEFLKSHFEDLPDFEEPVILKEILSEACMGENKLEALYDKNLVYFFESRLSSTQKNTLEKQVPAVLQVPSGSFIKVHYPIHTGPYIEVRLQEVFGWFETPKILAGKVSLTLHLLGPNYRPVQVTQDLKSFWGNGYMEVRKELKSRYPKHSWPEDPTTALAVAKGRSTKK